MSSGHSSSARMSSHGHSSVNDEVSAAGRGVHGSVGSSISRPPVAPRSDDRSAWFTPRSRYSAATGSTSPTVRPSAGEPGPHLRDPDRVRAGVDLAEVRLVDARRDLVEPDLGGVEVRPGDGRRGCCRSRAASRRPRRSRRAAASGRRPSRTRPRCRRSRRPGTSSSTSWVKNRLKPGQPTQFFAHRPVESDVQATDRPRPYCHCARSGIVARRDEHELRGRLDRRAVVAEEPGEAVLEAAQDRRRARLDREERLLDDLLAGDLLRLLEEDVGDRRDVRGGVEPAAAVPRELLEERVRAAAGTDGREGDPGRLHPRDDVVVLARAWTSRPSAG